MRVLFLVSDLSGAGGTQRVACTVASALAGGGDEVKMLSLFGPAEPFFDLAGEVETGRLGLSEARGSVLRAMRISGAVTRAVRRCAPDAVIAVDSVLMAFLLPMVLGRRPRLVCWEHFHLNTSHGSALRDIGRRVAVRLAARIVVLTGRDAENWRARFGPRTRVLDIPNPVPDLGGAHAAAEDAGGPRILLAVGRMTRQKGFDLLLDAWARVAAGHPDWRLRILGDGEERAALEAQVARLELGESVEMPGQVRDMAGEYARAGALVMSSRWEGLPMVLLEAQQAGLPTLSTDCETGPREVLGGGSGLLVAPDDPAALAEGLDRLLSDPDLRRALSEAARSNARRYRIDAVAQRWREILGSS